MNKKRIIMINIAALLLLVAVISTVAYKLAGTAFQTLRETEKSFIGADVDNVGYSVQYIRTRGWYDGFYPTIKLIRSVDELNAYYEENKGIYDLSRHDKLYVSETIGFPNACDKYDEAYFENQILVIIVVQEASGSYRHQTNMVGMTETAGEKRMIIDLETTDIDKIGTADVAVWHVLIEPEAGARVESESDITLLYNGMNLDADLIHIGHPILTEAPDDFCFSLIWGYHGVSSYDSKTGKLVKTTDTTHPEDYVAEYKLTTEESAWIYHMICKLLVLPYPSEYNPNENIGSDPSMDLILSMNVGWPYTISATNIAASYESDDENGQFFLDVCKYIQDVLTKTEEWKALPEYEFFYD